MRVLIAEDDAVSRQILETLLRNWGYEVVTTRDGEQAWLAMSAPDAPALAILDVMMPGVDGLEICRRVRRLSVATSPHIILLTAKHGARAIVDGMEAGADDYLTKPYDRDELRVRLQVGVRIVELQARLAARVSELEGALEHVKQLQGILPICSYCKKIRGDQDYWQTVESYVADHSEVEFSHGICPACYETTVKDELASFRALIAPVV
ncbi:MAG TPA: response regulator transcription factor [Pyrinomonadaceae bacterium]|nr:response regulator transcription factor [Pyrinomonadaceae bacterium]